MIFNLENDLLPSATVTGNVRKMLKTIGRLGKILMKLFLNKYCRILAEDVVDLRFVDKTLISFPMYYSYTIIHYKSWICVWSKLLKKEGEIITALQVPYSVFYNCYNTPLIVECI